jgi:hypothetical protein
MARTASAVFVALLGCAPVPPPVAPTPAPPPPTPAPPDAYAQEAAKIQPLLERR